MTRHIGSCRDLSGGFTLAEVLITLGIIGVVAPLTMPAIISHHQKQVTITKLKKAYSTLSQAFVSSVADNGSASSWVDENVLLTEDNIKEYFDLYWAPYLKVLRYCNSLRDCGYKDDIHYWNGHYGTLNLFGSTRRSILTTDGMYMLFRSIREPVLGSGDYYFSKNQDVYVDINAGKGPNVYGKDIFYFKLDLNDAKVYPYGINMSENEINSRCYGSNANYASTCAAKIMRDGWQMNY